MDVSGNSGNIVTQFELAWTKEMRTIMESDIKKKAPSPQVSTTHSTAAVTEGLSVTPQPKNEEKSVKKELDAEEVVTIWFESICEAIKKAAAKTLPNRREQSLI